MRSYHNSRATQIDPVLYLPPEWQVWWLANMAVGLYMEGNDAVCNDEI